MDAERKQILEMLAQGKITAEDAERLLDKLAASRSTDPLSDEGAGDDRRKKLKFFRVFVDCKDGEKVNIRVPLSLIKTGIALAAVLPHDVNKKLGEKGVDLGKLTDFDGDELNEALRDLQVDVDSDDGDTVRVFCE
jgi:hypothetical protein